METSLILAIDQGTSSSRAIIFGTKNWDVICQHQVEFESIYPEEGWCEQDPNVILETVKQVISYVFSSKLTARRRCQYFSLKNSQKSAKIARFSSKVLLQKWPLDGAVSILLGF